MVVPFLQDLDEFIAKGLHSAVNRGASARLLLDHSSSESPSHGSNPVIFWCINAIWFTSAVCVILVWCCRCNGSEQFTAWLNTSSNSDAQFARHQMQRRLDKEQANKIDPEKARTLLKQCWKRNHVTMVIQEADLIDGKESTLDIEALEDSSGNLALRMVNDQRRNVSNVCAVCLGRYEVGETVVWSNRCQHCFHEDCISDWLVKMQEGTPCPCCRQEFADIEEQRMLRKIKWAPGAAMDISVIRM